MKTEIRVAWGEMDVLGHVNNTVFHRWLETARIEWLDAVAYPRVDGLRGPVLRTATLEFLGFVKYPDTVTVTVAPRSLGRSSVTLRYEIFSARAQRVVATAETVVVFADLQAGTSLPLPDDVRARMQAQEGWAEGSGGGSTPT